MCDMGQPVVEIRILRPEESGLAAAIHRRAGALIPGYVTLGRTPESFQAFYRNEVMPRCAV